jgi:hypothetical protein
VEPFYFFLKKDPDQQGTWYHYTNRISYNGKGSIAISDMHQKAGLCDGELIYSKIVQKVSIGIIAIFP